MRLIPNTYEMIHTYSQDYEKASLPWPSWLAKITNIRKAIFDASLFLPGKRRGSGRRGKKIECSELLALRFDGW